jgi:hypothetical protein
VHDPPQFTKRPGHWSVHAPLTQRLPGEQIVPGLVAQSVVDAPQCTALVSGSKQLPSHFACDAAHTVVQVPPAQTWPGKHVMPGELQSAFAPQWLASVSGSKHVPPHFT